MTTYHRDSATRGPAEAAARGGVMLKSTAKALVASDVARNRPLEGVMIAAYQDPRMFIAGSIFPSVGHSDQTGTFPAADMDSIAQDKAQRRAPGTETQVGVYDASKSTFTTEAFAYGEVVPEEWTANGDFWAADEAAANNVAEVMLISRERRFSSYWTTGVWARDMAGAGTAVANTSYVYWNNSASTPILDVAAEKNLILLKSRRMPNTLAIGADVLPQLINHPTVLARYNAGQTPGGPALLGLSDDAQLQALAVVFGVSRVLVARGVYNSAKEGQATAVPAFCLNSKSAWLGYVHPKPNRFTPTAGARFTWQGLTGNAEGIRTWAYWSQARRSRIVEAQSDDVFKVVSSKCGMFFNGIVQ